MGLKIERLVLKSIECRRAQESVQGLKNREKYVLRAWKRIGQELKVERDQQGLSEM